MFMWPFQNRQIIACISEQKKYQGAIYYYYSKYYFLLLFYIIFCARLAIYVVKISVILST